MASGYGSGSFSTLAREMQSAAVQFAAVTSGVAVLAQSVNSFRQLEKQLTLTNAVSEGTVQNFRDMEKAARDFALVSNFGAAESAKSLYDLASAGFSATEALSAMSGVLLLAQATMAEASESADLIGSNIRAFGLQAQDATRVSNLFAAAIARSQADMPKLAFAFRQVGPVAKVANLEIEETTALLGLLFNVGLRGEQAGTALRNVIVRLANPVGEAAEILDALGIATTRADGKLINFFETMGKIKAAGLGEADLARLFGTEGLAGSVALLDGMGAKYNKLKGEITDTSFAWKMAQQQLNTLDGAMKLITNSFTEFGIVAGEQVAPYLRELSNMLVDFTQTWRELPKRVQDTYAEFGLFAVKAALVTVVGAKVLGTMKDLFMGAVNLRRSWLAMNAAIAAGTATRLTGWIVAAGPVAAALAAIGVAVAGLFAVFRYNNMKREMEAAFALQNIEPVEKFADDLERSLGRVKSTFQKGGFGDLDAQGALIDVQSNAKSSIEIQTQKIKELEAEQLKFEAAFKEYDGLNERLVNGLLTGKGAKAQKELRQRLSAVVAGGGDTRAIAEFIVAEARSAGLSADDIKILENALKDDTALFKRLEDLSANARKKGSASGQDLADIMRELFDDTGTILDSATAQLAKEIAAAKGDTAKLEIIFKQAAKQRMERADRFIDTIAKEAGGMNNAIVDHFAPQIKALMTDPDFRAQIQQMQATSTTQVGFDQIVNKIIEKLVADGLIDQKAVDALTAEGKRRLVLIDIGGREINATIRQLEAQQRKMAGEVNNSIADMQAVAQFEIAEDVKAQQVSFSEKVMKSLVDMLTGNEASPKNSQISQKLAALVSGKPVERLIKDELGKVIGQETMTIADDGFIAEWQKQLEEQMTALMTLNPTDSLVTTLRTRIDQTTTALMSIARYKMDANKKAENAFIEANEDFQNKLQDIQSESIKIKFQSGIEAGALLNGFVMPLDAVLEDLKIAYAEQLRKFDQDIGKLERDNPDLKKAGWFQQWVANVRKQMENQANIRVASKEEINRKELIAHRRLMDEYRTTRQDIENATTNAQIALLPELGLERINAQYEAEIRQGSQRITNETQRAKEEFIAKFENVVKPDDINKAMDQLGATRKIDEDLLAILPKELAEGLEALNRKRNAELLVVYQNGYRGTLDVQKQRRDYIRTIQREAQESQAELSAALLAVPGSANLEKALKGMNAQFDGMIADAETSWIDKQKELGEKFNKDDPAYDIIRQDEFAKYESRIATLKESRRVADLELRGIFANTLKTAQGLKIDADAARAAVDAATAAAGGFNPLAEAEANRRAIQGTFNQKMNDLESTINAMQKTDPGIDTAATRTRLAGLYEDERKAALAQVDRQTQLTITGFENSQRDMIEGVQDSILDAERRLAELKPFNFDLLKKLDQRDIERQVREAGQSIDDTLEQLRIEGKLSPQIELAMNAYKENLTKTIRDGLTIEKERTLADAARDLRDSLAEFGEEARIAINEAQIAIASNGSGTEAVELAELFKIRDTEEITSRFNQQLRSLDDTYTDLKRRAGENGDEVARLDANYQRLKASIEAARDAELERAGSAEATARRGREALDRTVENMIESHRYSGEVMDGIRAGVLASQLEIQTAFDFGMGIVENALGGTVDLMEAAFTRGREGFADMLKDMARQLIKAQVYQLLLKMVGFAAGAMGFTATGMTSSTQAGVVAAAGNPASGSAKGNVFEDGNMRRFAGGGVVNRYTEFNTRDGRRNSMAENGPEAIMPLQRTADGRLGVVGMGGGANNNFNINVAVNANGGEPAQNEDLARQIGKQIDMQVRAIVGAELRTQTRPGGTMNRR
jgi:TP901 family phage tail tape measure protein